MVEERQKGGDALGGQHGSDLRRQGHFLALPDRGFRAILIFDSHQMVRIVSQPEGVCEVRYRPRCKKAVREAWRWRGGTVMIVKKRPSLPGKVRRPVRLVGRCGQPHRGKTLGARSGPRPVSLRRTNLPEME
jgi:hypothetical protein